ncbi:hypothetical protein [Azohydromonas sp.]|uniref:hypothetical protein n=1 Tax=Azohydromonas sp. TaxID=1872666 RepID=UPI002C302201|nr:hypothetical protein [Azohydromonas sp.]HMM84344.1 hypothetical protein [Azohydromonas sp.]
MAAHDERIAWLLSAEAIDGTNGDVMASLSAAAAAGFRAVAIHPSTWHGSVGQRLQARATCLGLRCVVLHGASHHRLSAPLGGAERRSLANALSREGFDGLILCVGGEVDAPVASLLATARALVRDLDQRDWERYQ